jgi:hypothetical protein
MKLADIPIQKREADKDESQVRAEDLKRRLAKHDEGLDHE